MKRRLPKEVTFKLYLGEPYAEVRGYSRQREKQVRKDKAGSLAAECGVASVWALWGWDFDYGKERKGGCHKTTYVLP